jgi:hypothetical protein
MAINIPTLYEQKANKCTHFNGIQNKTCKAGVAYDDLRSKRVDGKEWMPCLRDVGECVPCEKRQWRTAEEIQKEIEQIEKRSAEMMLVAAAIIEDQTKLGLKKGNGGSSQVDCPVCKSGKVRYAVSSYNGHRHVACTTANCVAWME